MANKANIELEGAETGPSPLVERLEGIRKSLMAHHSSGSGMPSATKGSERETVVSQFLAKVFAATFRFGRGAITDATGTISGQLDIVVELPFFPSFPTVAADDRLYLAESVALVIEVKSNLATEWDGVERSAEKLRQLRRRWLARLGLSRGSLSLMAPVDGGSMESRIPFIALGFTGYGTLERLAERIRSTPEEKRPDAVLVFESGAYFDAKSNSGDIGLEGYFAFSTGTSALMSEVLMATPDFRGYLKPGQVPANSQRRSLVSF